MRKRWVVRTIRPGGWVKIYGQKYRVVDVSYPYDGRLDGLRMYFVLYPRGDDPEQFEDYIYLWGTEQRARALRVDPVSEIDWPGPDCVDGAFPWAWWRRIASTTTP